MSPKQGDLIDLKKYLNALDRASPVRVRGRVVELTGLVIKAAIAGTLLVGDGLLGVEVIEGPSRVETERFYRSLVSPTHHLVYGDIQPEFFMFNNPESACRTCGGLGVHKFFLGYTTAGIIQLVVGIITCFSISGIIGIVEGIIYLTKSDEEFVQTYQVGKKEWF